MPKKPIDLIVSALLAKVRLDASGAKSLAHILVVVPTAQSGRRLRRILAERLKAVVPPMIKTPRGMMLDESDAMLACRTDEISAFATVLGDCAVRLGAQEGSDLLLLARQLADIRIVLSSKALFFSDVLSVVKSEMPDDSERWNVLAEIEVQYLAELKRRGKKDSISAMKEFKPDWPEIEEVICFDDPVVLANTLKCALAPIQISQVEPCATAADEAERIAEIFAQVKSDEAWPALCVADARMFTEIVAAMRAKGVNVHDPSETRLSTSSLGHLVSQIVSLLRTSSYSVFSAFIRGGDVRRWICSELEISDEEMTEALIDLDGRQAEYLPQKIDDIRFKTRSKLRAIFELVDIALRKKGLRGILQAIFSGRTLDQRDPASREFAAAAEVVNRLIDECAGDHALLELRLEESTYSLEPDEGADILTDGWMELPFLDADELIVAGFQEGCVPESTFGHPFLPDSLRTKLGLPDNATKELRDRAIFRMVISSRATQAVKVFFHRVDSSGDMLKPSRLLFETSDDSDLVARVEKFYASGVGSSESSAPDIPESWRLKLPIPPEERQITDLSPTRIDLYLRCPFTCYLRDKNVLGDKRMDDKAQELAPWEYGNMAHEALEKFGTCEVKDSTKEKEIADFLCVSVDEWLHNRFGSSVPIIVAMQGESVKRRLAHFSKIQAERRKEGWRIMAAERKLEVQYGHTRFHGKCDRIDFNDATGQWCVIDYKTWDTAQKAEFLEINKKDGSQKWNSIQLPLYCAMLDAENTEFAHARLDKILSCYCVLGKSADEVKFTEGVGGAFVPEAEKLVRNLIERMERGIFWPPGKNKEWEYEYASWLNPSPETTVSPEWIADQNRRIESMKGDDL
ncbi:MAG: PD-(D/E)XK nuclease family protein [Kiritimatiellae bacterium]|nr:PD-(D/E)XK nuclease family protein [Kiritimatiellia bacterium]